MTSRNGLRQIPRARLRPIVLAVVATVLVGSGLSWNPVRAFAAPAHTLAGSLLLAPPHPEACGPSTDGQEEGPDSDGITWKCICFPRQGGGQECEWVAVDYPDPPSEETILVNVNSSMLMDITGPNMQNGTLIHQWTNTAPPNGGVNQRWRLHASFANGFDQIVSEYSSKCVGVGGSSLNQGASIVEWDCNSHTDQRWALAFSGDFFNGFPAFNILDLNSKLVIGISAGSRTIGANAVQWPWNGSLDQEWALPKVL
ncbi:MAG TPA: RICIN domain-containing protein [Candidatus Dormibacteraeota bacterium]|nr:RICIN domain-containing protein [Candidatus Dormibacteraeota bacterium]